MCDEEEESGEREGEREGDAAGTEELGGEADVEGDDAAGDDEDDEEEDDADADKDDEQAEDEDDEDKEEEEEEDDEGEGEDSAGIHVFVSVRAFVHSAFNSKPASTRDVSTSFQPYFAYTRCMFSVHSQMCGTRATSRAVQINSRS